MFRQIIYFSGETIRLSEGEMGDLLVASRKANGAVGVTGVLLYRTGNYFQVLEGESQVVGDTFEKISQDRRHRRVLKISDLEVSSRDFPNWSMYFKAIPARDSVFTDLFDGRMVSHAVRDQLTTFLRAINA